MAQLSHKGKRSRLLTKASFRQAKASEPFARPIIIGRASRLQISCSSLSVRWTALAPVLHIAEACAARCIAAVASDCIKLARGWPILLASWAGMVDIGLLKARIGQSAGRAGLAI